MIQQINKVYTLYVPQEDIEEVRINNSTIHKDERSSLDIAIILAKAFVLDHEHLFTKYIFEHIYAEKHETGGYSVKIHLCIV